MVDLLILTCSDPLLFELKLSLYPFSKGLLPIMQKSSTKLHGIKLKLNADNQVPVNNSDDGISINSI
jgi:hypothetical protein